jgi:hypothetical protein
MSCVPPATMAGVVVAVTDMREKDGIERVEADEATTEGGKSNSSN